MQDRADVGGFYGALADRGQWVDSDYGDLWCPSPQAVGADFTPYTRGHFEYGEGGWTWVGDLPESWAVEHYGRWVETGDEGCDWGWVPDDEWGPAWVDFEVGDGVIAWAPRPPALPRLGRPKVRVAAPAKVRLAMPRVTMLAARASGAGAVGRSSTPGAAAKAQATAAKGGGSGSSSKSSSGASFVVVVKANDLLAPEIWPVMLRGGDFAQATSSLKPITDYSPAALRGDPEPAGHARSVLPVAYSGARSASAPAFGGRAWNTAAPSTVGSLGHSSVGFGGGRAWGGGSSWGGGHSWTSGGHSSSSSSWGGGGHSSSSWGGGRSSGGHSSSSHSSSSHSSGGHR
jgi:hypothetical protein